MLRRNRSSNEELLEEPQLWYTHASLLALGALLGLVSTYSVHRTNHRRRRHRRRRRGRRRGWGERAAADRRERRSGDQVVVQV